MNPTPAGEVCIFCLTHRERQNACTYGLGHEYPNDTLAKRAPPPQPKKKDTKLCAKCGLHPKNPVYNTNGCEHEHG